MSATGLLRSRNHPNLRSIAQWVEGVGKVGFFCFVFLFFFFLLLLHRSAKVTKSSGCKAVHVIIAD